MQVKVEDALPGSVPSCVDQIYPSWAKRPPDHASDPNGRGHRLLRVLATDVPQVLRMVPRDDKDVPRGRWMDVHDRNHEVVFVDPLGRSRPFHDRAEDATSRHGSKGTAEAERQDANGVCPHIVSLGERCRSRRASMMVYVTTVIDSTWDPPP